MTITVINSEVNLPDVLMRCKCGRGDLKWDGHYKWGCYGPSLWKQKCQFGLSFEAIVKVDEGGVMEQKLMGGVRFDRVPFTEYGIELLWLHLRWRRGLVKKEVGIQVDFLTDADIVALYGVNSNHSLLHEEQGDERKSNKRNESSRLLKKPPVSF